MGQASDLDILRPCRRISRPQRRFGGPVHPVPVSPRPDIALRATNLAKLYGETVALWNVEVVARGGDLVSVLGPNASGKTTLLRILAGLTAPSRGRVAWTLSPPDRRPRIGYLGHATHLYEALTPVENVGLAARLARRDPLDAMDLLARLGVTAFGATRCSSLSAGTLRRVALARVLATDPDVLIVDEPFASLDAPAADAVAEVLVEARADRRLVVMATHDDARSRLISTAVVSLGTGRAGWTTPEQATAGRHAQVQPA